ncbi:MAG: hypothetical protein U0174_19505 [Polyangiaceae bacterium]
MKRRALAMFLALSTVTAPGCTRKLTSNEPPPPAAFADPDYDRTSNTHSCDRFCAGFCATCAGGCDCEMRQKPSHSRGYAGMGGKECIGVCTGGGRDARSNTRPK